MNATQTKTREEKILKEMAQYFPGTPVETRRLWATERVDKEERYAEDSRRLREWQGTEAGMQEMFS